jgi:hypothetical protein
MLNVRVRSGKTATGKVLLADGSVKVLGDSLRQFARADVLSFTTGGPKERNLLDGNGGAGVQPALCNVRTRSRPAPTCAFQRRTVENRVTLDYLGNFSSTNDVDSANNHRANATWDWFFSEKVFLRPVFFEYFKDPFQNIDSRFTLGTGIGYQLIENAKTDWSIFAGPAYQTTRFDEVPPGESDSEDTAALSVGTTFDTELTSDIDFIYDYRFQLTNPESGKYNHHMIGTFEMELTDALDFDLPLVWDRIEDPHVNADGSIPEQDDYRVIVGIGYDF